MKSSKNLLDFFKVQTVTLPCPACGIHVPKTKMNIHLDSECTSSVLPEMQQDRKLFKEVSSSSNKFPTETCSKSKTLNLKMKSNSKITTSKNSPKKSRLSLKQQRNNAKKKELKANINFPSIQKCVEEPEIITLDDDDDSSFASIKQVANSSGEEPNKNLSYSTAGKNSANLNKSSIESVVEAKECLELNSFDIKDTVPVGKESIKTVDLSKTTEIATIDMNSMKNTTESGACDRKNSDLISVPTETSKSQELLEAGQELKFQDNSNVNNDMIALLNDAKESIEADNDVFIENSDSNTPSETYSPYYIANFKYILNNVLSDEYYKALFNDEDMHFVNAFENLSDPAQKLYVRLFQRKYNWLKLSKINYPNISKDPAIILEELVSKGLVDSGLDMIDLETALDLLSLPEARNIAKQFNFNSSGKNKSDITSMMLKHCKEHRSVFFSNGKNSVSNAMLKKVKQILGQCYRIFLIPKRLFTRILMLFSLSSISEDDDDAAGGQQQQLLTLLLVNKGELSFPDYKINRQTVIFSERDELIRYEEAKQLENDIMNAVESKNFDLAKELFVEAKEEFENQIQCPFVERVAALPTYLKKFSSFHIYVRCMTQGVEILQKLRQYREAVDLLKRLLAQKIFCLDYHGRWWDRMALNLEQHLKQKQEALDAIKEAMNDKNVRKGYRYSLVTRGLRILKSIEEADEVKNEMIEAANVIEAPKVTISGRLFPRNVLGRRNIFISSSGSRTNEDDITVLGVEQLAIEHYKNEGFTEGIHGESSTFHFIYGLLFWDIIYDGDIPDAFISPYQTHPLDFNHEPFFSRREKQIMNHLETLRNSTIEELKEVMKATWEAHFGQTSLVMWDRFTDLEHALGLVNCMGNNLICGICERLARDYRFSRSGVPDLVVWNPETLRVKIVEVKGPGDKLSSKQILWLDYLLRLGAEAEVCHIEAVGSKKLRKE